MGIRRIQRFGIAIAAVIAAGVTTLLVHSGGSSSLSYSLPETLPKMVSSFGSGARIAEISVGSDDVYFQVIGADGRLHIRDYTVAESEVSAGTEGYNRKVENTVRAATARETRGAVLTLGQIDPHVVDKLYAKVGFPRVGSEATLTGRDWYLESGASVGHRYFAAYDGTGLKPTQQEITPDPDHPATTTTATSTQTTQTTQTATTTSTTVLHFSTTINSAAGNSRSARTAQRLLSCITRAQGDVNRIAACQRKYVP